MHNAYLEKQVGHFSTCSRLHTAQCGKVGKSDRNQSGKGAGYESVVPKIRLLTVRKHKLRMRVSGFFIKRYR